MSSSISADLAASCCELLEIGRHAEAYALTRPLWEARQIPEDLDLTSLVQAARLASRLGGDAHALVLFREAHRRDRTHPLVRIFAEPSLSPRRSLLDLLRLHQDLPELPNASPRQQLTWIGIPLCARAALRDHASVDTLLSRAAPLAAHDPGWFALLRGEAAFHRDHWSEASVSAAEAAQQLPWLFAVQHLRFRLALRLGQLDAWLADTARLPQPTWDIACLRLHTTLLLAEREEGSARDRRLADADLQLADLPATAPLADSAARQRIEILRLDLATQRGDIPATLAAAESLRSPWHRRLAENLRNHPPAPVLRVPHSPVWQTRNTCLPCSLATLHPQVDASRLSADLTYDGTAIPACSAWLREHAGLELLPFIVRRETALALLHAGHGFVFLTRGENWAHAMAAIGADPAQGMLIIHDPSAHRLERVFLDDLGLGESPFGPQGLILASPEQLPHIRDLIPETDREPYRLYLEMCENIRQHGARAGQPQVQQLWSRFPRHPFALRASALHLVQSGRGGGATGRLQSLLNQIPGNFHLRLDLLHACHSRGNSRLLTQLYASLLEEDRRRGPSGARLHNPVWLARHADMSGLTSDGAEHALSRLRLGLRRAPYEAELWHILGDILWRKGDLIAARLPHRIAATLAAENAHYADAVFRVHFLSGDAESGLAFLRHRADHAGRAEGSAIAWITLHEALAEAGRPREARDALHEALRLLPDNPALLHHAIGVTCGEGDWAEARRCLDALRRLPASSWLRRAEILLAEARGENQNALNALREECRLNPNDPQTARTFLQQLIAVDGQSRALQEAERLHRRQPEHEGFFDIWIDHLSNSFHNGIIENALRNWLRDDPDNVDKRIHLAHLRLDALACQPPAARPAVEQEIDQLLQDVRLRAFPTSALLRLEARRDHANALALLHDALLRHVNDSGLLHDWIGLIDSRPAAERMNAFRHLAADLRARGCESEALIRFFVASAAAGGLPFALLLLDDFRAERPGDGRLLHIAVQLHLVYARGAEDLRQARDLAAQGLRDHPALRVFPFLHATALLRLGELPEAEAAFRAFLDRSPLHPDARLELSRLAAWRGDDATALALLETGRDLQPQRAAAWEALADFHLDHQAPEEAEKVLRAARNLLDSDLHLAERHLRLLLQLGRNEEALAEARRLLDEFSEGAWLHFLHGNTLESLHRPPADIEAAYREALRHNASLFAAADQLAAHLTQQGRPAEARSLLETFAGREDNEWAVQGRLAWILQQENRPVEARNLLRETLQRHPDYAWGWMLYLDLLEEAGSLREAREALHSIPEACAHQLDWRVRRLQVLENCGEKNEALDREWAELTATFPRNGRVMLTYADRCLERKDYDEAERILDLYEPVDPAASYLIARRALLHARRHQRHEAIALALDLWSRPDPGQDWSDEHVWQALALDTDLRKVRDLANTVFAHLKAGRPLKPWVLQNLIASGAKPRPAAWIGILRTHPDADGLIAAVLEALIHKPTHDLAWKLWQKLPLEQRLRDTRLWDAGLSLLIFRSIQAPLIPLFDAILKDWWKRPDLATHMLTNAVIGLSEIVGIHKYPPRALSEHQRERLRNIEALCQHGLEKLPRSNCTRYLATLSCSAALLLDKTDLFHERLSLHHDLLKTPDEDYWSNPREEALRRILPSLGKHLRAQPPDPDALLRFAELRSRLPHAPYLLLHHLCEQVRRQVPPGAPPLRYKLKRPPSATRAQTRRPLESSERSLRWLMFITFWLLLRFCIQFFKDQMF